MGTLLGRAVVLGAGGFAGRYMVDGLVADGWDVVAVTHGRACPWPGLEHVVCDATDPAALMRAVEGADCVVNATGAGPAAAVRIAQNLALLLRQDAVGHVTHLSSLAVFGQAVGTMSEAVRPRPALGHRYAHAKWRAERILTAGPRAGRSLILRPGCIYGPGAVIWVERIARLIRCGRLGSLGSRGLGLCPLIHAADVATAVRRCTGMREAGVRHLVSPERLTWNAYFQRVARLLGVPLRDMGAAELAREVWLAAFVRRALAGAGACGISPAMARLFRSSAVIVSERPPFQAADEFRGVAEALDEAIEFFLRDAAHGEAVAAARRQPGWAKIA